MLAACGHGRVHLLRLEKPADAPPSTAEEVAAGRPLELAATPRLAGSTRAARALQAACREARREMLRPGAGGAPDSLPLRRGAVLRCDLARDVVAVEGLSSPDLLLRLHGMCRGRPRPSPHHGREPNSLLAGLAAVRHLGIDLSGSPRPERFLAQDGGGGGVPSPRLETALAVFAASLPSLENIWLLTTSETNRHLPRTTTTTTTTSFSTPDPGSATDPTERHRDDAHVRPAAVDYPRLPQQSLTDQGCHCDYDDLVGSTSRWVRLACAVRLALDDPPVVTDADDEEALRRLRQVGVGVLDWGGVDEWGRGGGRWIGMT